MVGGNKARMWLLDRQMGFHEGTVRWWFPLGLLLSWDLKRLGPSLRSSQVWPTRALSSVPLAEGEARRSCLGQ